MPQARQNRGSSPSAFVARKATARGALPDLPQGVPTDVAEHTRGMRHLVPVMVERAA